MKTLKNVTDPYKCENLSNVQRFANTPEISQLFQSFRRGSKIFDKFPKLYRTLGDLSNTCANLVNAVKQCTYMANIYNKTIQMLQAHIHSYHVL